MAQICVTHVRVVVINPERREAFGRSFGDGRTVYIDYKDRADFVLDDEICLGAVLGGELVPHRRRREYALQTYRCFSKEELRMSYMQRVLASGH